MKVIILDNVLPASLLKDWQDEKTPTTPEWTYGKHHPLIEAASPYYDTSKIKGFETWLHRNTRPEVGFHYDRDEYSYAVDKKLKFPIFSLIFYITVEDLEGGELNIENNIKITPKENRLVILAPKVKHGVEEFTGCRTSLNINPWERVLIAISAD
jgi:hypothetical protein